MGEIDVKVQPRSSRNRIEIVDGQVKVWLTAPPTDGQANAALCELIGKRLGVAKTKVSVVRGDTSRQKRVAVEGLTTAEVLQTLANTD